MMSNFAHAASGTSFTLFSNPYCLWCYAFGPAIAQFRQRVSNSSWTVVVGDLFNGDNAATISPSFITYLQQHARRATEYSRMVFAPEFWALLATQTSFDSSNAATAMRTFAKAYPRLAVAAFDDLQHRLFAQGIDISQWPALQTWARENGAAVECWQEWPHHPRALNLQKNDAQLVRRWSLNAFPALLVSHPNTHSKWLTRGFSVADVMWQQYQSWQPLSASPHCSDGGCHG